MWGIDYMSVRSMMLVFELVLGVQIEGLVAQKYKGYLEMRCVWMLGDFGYLLVLLDCFGKLSVKTDLGVLG